MPLRKRRHSPKQQRGALFLLLVVILVLGGAAVFYGVSKPIVSDVEKENRTTAALEQAKAGLIGYAVAVAIDGTGIANRPGDLPCPDTNDDGNTEANCGNAAGTTGQANRIGRLPWRTLGLPDLRDGDGERLWYAVSNNFKYNTRTTCTAPGAAGCLNSDTVGTITIRDRAGNIIHNATGTDPTTSGVAAVIFSPGAVLRRQGAGAAQNRTCTGGSCNAAGACTSTPVTNTPKCNPANYLDTITGTEDNANFTDGSATNGFINGIVRDAGGNVIVNDRLMVITYQDLMPQLEKRVIAEVTNCMTSYAAANNGRYPWAAPVTDVTPPYAGTINTLFGRVPDQPHSESLLGIISVGGPVGGLLSPLCGLGLCLSVNWPASCPLPLQANTGTPTTTWWNNWKLHVFYGVADAYKPQIGFSLVPLSLSGITPPTGCPSCLTVDPPSAVADKQFVVMMAGRRLPAVAGGQPRTSTANRQNPVNYLEGGNDTHPDFTKQTSGTTFNDTIRYK